MHARGLYWVADLVKDILQIEKSGEVHPYSLRSALAQVLYENPRINTSPCTGEVWVNTKAERLTTILNHVRRAARMKCPAQVFAKTLTASEHAKVADMLISVDLTGDAELAQQQQSASSSNSTRAQPLEQPTPSESASGKPLTAQKCCLPKAKFLKKNVSDVSMDSDGFPQLLRTPPRANGPAAWESLPSKASAVYETPPSKKVRKNQEEQTELAEVDELARQSLGLRSPILPVREVLKRPAAKALPKQRSFKCPPPLVRTPLKKREQTPAKKKAVLRKTPPEPLAAEAPERQPWAKLRKTVATNRPRSYITGTYEAGQKPMMIVEVSAAMSPDYEDIIAKILVALQNEHLTKQEALALRSKLLGKAA